MNAVFVVTPAQIRAAARAAMSAAGASGSGSQAEDLGSPRLKAWADGGSSRAGADASMDESFEAGSLPGAFPRGLQVRRASAQRSEFTAALSGCARTS